MRIRECKDKDEMARLVDDFLTTGWKVKEQGAGSTLMQKKTWGGAFGLVAIVVGLLLSIPTIGISLLLLAYPIYAHFGAEKMLIRIGAAPETKVGTM